MVKNPKYVSDTRDCSCILQVKRAKQRIFPTIRTRFPVVPPHWTLKFTIIALVTAGFIMEDQNLIWNVLCRAARVEYGIMIQAHVRVGKFVWHCSQPIFTILQRTSCFLLPYIVLVNTLLVMGICSVLPLSLSGWSSFAVKNRYTNDTSFPLYNLFALQMAWRQSQPLFLSCFFITERCSPLPYLPEVNAGLYTGDLGSTVTMSCVPDHVYPDGGRKMDLTCNTETREWTPLQSCLGGTSPIIIYWKSYHQYPWSARKPSSAWHVSRYCVSRTTCNWR